MWLTWGEVYYDKRLRMLLARDVAPSFLTVVTLCYISYVEKSCQVTDHVALQFYKVFFLQNEKINTLLGNNNDTDVYLLHGKNIFSNNFNVFLSCWAYIAPPCDAPIFLCFDSKE